jgi:membrane protein
VAAGDHAGLSFSLIVSLAAAVWSASGGFYNLDRAVRIAYGLPAQTYLQARGRAVLGAFVVVLLIGVGAIAAPAFAVLSTPALSVVAIPVALAVIAAGVAALYRFSAGRPVPMRDLVPGAAAAALGVVLVGTGFGAYVATSSRYTAVYGALAGAVIGMLAIYLAVYAVLIGAVLNVQLGGHAREDTSP